MEANNQLKQLAAKAQKEAQFYAYLKQNPEKHIQELARQETAGIWKIRTEVLQKLNVPKVSKRYTKPELVMMLTKCTNMQKGLSKILGHDWERFSGYPDWELIYKSEIRELNKHFEILMEDIKATIKLIESREPSTPNSQISERKKLGITVYLRCEVKGNTHGLKSKTIRELLQANGHEPNGPMFDNVRQSYDTFKTRVLWGKDIPKEDITALQELLPSLSGKEYDLAFEILQKATKTPR